VTSHQHHLLLLLLVVLLAPLHLLHQQARVRDQAAQVQQAVAAAATMAPAGPSP
jgi:hypothetical protein